jgi:hypothetical protein
MVKHCKVSFLSGSNPANHVIHPDQLHQQSKRLRAGIMGQRA